MSTDKISRRTLGGLAAAGAGVPLLAACSSDDPDSAKDSSGTTSTGSDHPSGEQVTQASAITVGGGQIFADQEVVVTQPTEGEFKCFTAICSHQGCLVSGVADGTINCDCHGSKYSIENGDVEQGPATFPLAEVPIKVSGDSISFA